MFGPTLAPRETYSMFPFHPSRFQSKHWHEYGVRGKKRSEYDTEILLK
jgi:hypothetical protein